MSAEVNLSFLNYRWIGSATREEQGRQQEQAYIAIFHRQIPLTVITRLINTIYSITSQDLLTTEGRKLHPSVGN